MFCGEDLVDIQESHRLAPDRSSPYDNSKQMSCLHMTVETIINRITTIVEYPST